MIISSKRILLRFEQNDVEHSILVRRESDSHVGYLKDPKLLQSFILILLAIQDLHRGLMLKPLWLTLALEDIRLRYMRAFGGVAWVFASFALFVFVKTIIFTPLSDKGANFFAAYVTIGYFVWAFVNSSMTEGCTTFISAKAWIHGSKIPLSTFVYKTVTRNIILTAINALVVILALILFPVKMTSAALYSIPLFLFLPLNALWVTILFAVISARFRDFLHMVSTVMRVMLFLTPILWLPEQLGGLWDILVFNPMAHFVILLRDPILEGTIPLISLSVVCAVTVAGWTVALMAFAYARNKIAFWV